MSALIKYEAARYALQQAVSFDEVMSIKDVAERATLYAKQAKDTELIERATEIRVRAERKAGQMLIEAKANGDLAVQGGDRKSKSHDGTLKLEDIGITKNESSRWQKLAAVDDEKFEKAISAAKEVAGEITTAAMLRIERAQITPAPKPSKALKTETPKKEADGAPPAATETETELVELRERVVELAKTAKDLLDENTSMGAAFDADDKLAALAKENTQLREMNRVLNERIYGLQGELNEARSAAKLWRSKYDKAARLAA